MPQFRKKPVVIEARKLAIDNAAEVLEWCGASWWTDPDSVQRDGIAIETLEGVMVARNGDWIIQGVAGEFYPCKAAIFERTYEPVD